MRWVYLAKTVAYGGPYPTTGNAFGLKFLDRFFSPFQGTQAVTDTTRSVSGVAVGRTLDGSYCSEGEVVLAIPGPKPPGAPASGKWHILRLSSEFECYLGKSSGTITTTGSVIRYTGGAETPALDSMGNPIVDSVVNKWPNIANDKWVIYAKLDAAFYIVSPSGGGGGADLVYFTVPTDRNPANATFNVTFVEALGSQSPTLTAGAFTVWDGYFKFPFAVANAEGVAVFNATENRWDVLYCEQMCLFARALVNNPSGFVGADNPVPIDNFQAVGYGMYLLPPTTLPTSAGNRRKHRGRDNDELLIIYDFADGKWQIVDSPHRSYTWIVKPTGNAGGGIAKGSAGAIVVQVGPDTGLSMSGQALYAPVVDGKYCTAWQDDGGTIYVAPGECQ